MATQTSNYIEAIHNLSPGGTLIFHEVPWEDYEQLLDELVDRPGVRVNYVRGRLEIMTLSQFHEMYADLLQDLALMTAERMGFDFESRGSATHKKKSFRSGAEPDGCFYVQNAAQIIGKRKIDLNRDPAPDIIVEIDVSHTSLYKLDFYAHLGVPEFWRYDEKRLHIYHLIEQSYIEAQVSRAFPVLTSDSLTQFLEQSKTEGQSAARRAFGQWLKVNLPVTD